MNLQPSVRNSTRTTDVAAFTAVLDACVLYPDTLRDFLVTLACTDLFRARWTEAIHEEWMRNLLANRPDRDRAKLERTRELMDLAVPDCLVTGYETLIETVTLPDPDDRHVLTAAIQCGADSIVTFNLKDFPAEVLGHHGITAQHPDELVTDLIELSSATVCRAAKEHRARLRNTPTGTTRSAKLALRRRRSSA